MRCPKFPDAPLTTRRCIELSTGINGIYVSSDEHRPGRLSFHLNYEEAKLWSRQVSPRRIILAANMYLTVRKARI